MSDLVAYESSGLCLKYRPDEKCDRGIITEVVEWDTYKLKGKPYETANVVDIGAQAGVFSAFAASLFPDAKIVAVELDQQNVDLCRINTAKYPNVTVVHGAVIGSKPAFGYRRNPINSGGHHIYFHDQEGALPLPPTMTLADVLLDHNFESVDLLKVDCEGAEHEILRLANEDGTLQKVKRIATEYHDFFGEKSTELIAMLRERYVVEVVPTNEISGMLYAEVKP